MRPYGSTSSAGARPDDGAAFEHDDAIGESARLVAIVRHVEYRHRELVPTRSRYGRIRRRSSRSTAASGSSSSSTSGADISARASATRCRSPPDSIDTPRSSSAPTSRIDATDVERQLLARPLTVGDVAANVEVREERDVLRDIADVPLVGRQVDALRWS